MKKGVKISLIVLGILLGIGIAVFIGADVIVSKYVTKKVHEALAEMPAGEASCGTVTVRLFSGTAAIDDIRFSYRGTPVNRKDTIGPGSLIHIERIDIGRVFYSMLLQKELLVLHIDVIRPEVELWMDEEHPELCFPPLPEDTTKDSTAFPLKRAALKFLRVKNASLALHSVRTKLDVVADSCSISVQDLAYDSVFSYCDSLYSLRLAHANVLTPDGRMRIEARDIEQSDQGAFQLGEARIANTMSKKRLGDIVKEPCTWIDMHIGRVSTSAFNPLRKALAQDMTLDKIEAEVKRMDVFRDERYQPKSPFPMPQKILMDIPVVFDIRHVDAKIHKIFIEFASTKTNIGKMQLGHITANITNVTNRRGATMKVKGGCPIDKGKAKAGFEMTMNKDCQWGLQMHVEHVNTTLLDPFIRPLVGMTSECIIDTLDTHYTGNSIQADGTFRMLYHGLKVKVHKEDDIPYKIITKNANTFTSLANTLLPKANPSSPGHRPNAFKITWKRNEWKPVPLYLFGPCIDGVKKTMLPGLYIHLQTKDK